MSFEHEWQETNRDGNLSQITSAPGAIRKRTPQCFRSCLVIPFKELRHQGKSSQRFVLRSGGHSKSSTELPLRTLAAKRNDDEFNNGRDDPI